MKPEIEAALKVLGLSTASMTHELVERRYKSKKEYFSSTEHRDEQQLKKLDEAYRLIITHLKPQPLNSQGLLIKLKTLLSLKDNTTQINNISALQKEVLSHFGEEALSCLNRLLEQFNLFDLCQLFFHVEKNGDPKIHAERLITIFGDHQTGFRYLTDFCRFNSNCNQDEVVHEACLFDIPEKAHCNFSQWKILAQKNLLNHSFRVLFGHAASIERAGKIGQLTTAPDTKAINAVKSELKKAQQDYYEVDSQARGLNDVDRNAKRSALSTKISMLRKKLAELSQGAAFANLDIMTLQAFYEKYQSETSEAHKILVQHGINEQNIAKFSTLERQNDDAAIPNLIIDGKNYGYTGFYIKKLDTLSNEGAAIAACLGKLTDCCQYLGGVGEECAIYGIESPNAGFYVLCQGDAENPSLKDTIFAQAFAWRSDTNGICLDSIESTKESWFRLNAVIRSLFRVLSYQLCFDNGISAVTISSKTKQVHYGYPAADQHQSCQAYAGYSDAHSQSLLASKNAPFLFLGEPALYSRQSEIVANIHQVFSLIFSDKQKLHQNSTLHLIIDYALEQDNYSLIKELKEIANQYHRLPEWQSLFLDKLDTLHQQIYGHKKKHPHTFDVLRVLDQFKTDAIYADIMQKNMMFTYYSFFVYEMIDVESERIQNDEDYKLSVLEAIIEAGLFNPFEHQCFNQPFDWSNRQNNRVWSILLYSAIGEGKRPSRHYLDGLLENCPDNESKQRVAAILIGKMSPYIMVNPNLFSRLLNMCSVDFKNNLAIKPRIPYAAIKPESLRILLDLLPDHITKEKVLLELNSDDLCMISKNDNQDSMRMILDNYPAKDQLLTLIQTPRLERRGETPLQYMTRKKYNNCISLFLQNIPEHQKLAFLKIRLKDNFTMADYCLQNKPLLPQDSESYTKSFLAIYEQATKKPFNSDFFSTPEEQTEIRKLIEKANTFEEFKTDYTRSLFTGNLRCST